MSEDGTPPHGPADDDDEEEESALRGVMADGRQGLLDLTLRLPLGFACMAMVLESPIRSLDDDDDDDDEGSHSLLPSCAETSPTAPPPRATLSDPAPITSSAPRGSSAAGDTLWGEQDGKV